MKLPKLKPVVGIAVGIGISSIFAGCTLFKPPPSSWNSAVSIKPKVVTVNQLTDGKTFQKLGSKGGGSCCPGDTWKRALPDQWQQQYPGQFAQVAGLRVLGVDYSHADACSEGGTQHYDTHVRVRAADSPGGIEFTVEFDRCWRARGLIDYTLPKEGDVIDAQGFVTWDVSAWELHPVSAWRISRKKPESH